MRTGRPALASRGRRSTTRVPVAWATYGLRLISLYLNDGPVMRHSDWPFDAYTVYQVARKRVCTEQQFTIFG